MARGLAALLLLAVVAVAALLIIVHTAWGRDQLRARLEAALDAQIAGDAHIGRLEGSVLGEVVLYDVVLHDATGAPTVVIDRIALDVGLWSALSGEVDLAYVRARGVVIHARQEPAGAVNLATLVVLDDEPLSWDVTIGELAITDARVEVTRSGATDHLDDLALTGALAVRARGTQVSGNVRLAARWRERMLPLAAAGTVGFLDGAVAVRDATLSAGAIAVTTAAFRVDGAELAGELHAVAPAWQLATLLPGLPLRGDVAATLVLAPGERAGTTAVAVAGTLGDAALAGTLGVDPETREVRGALRADDVGVGALVDVAVPAGLDVPLALTLDGVVDLDDGHADAALTARAPAGTHLSATATARFAGSDGVALRGHVAVRGLDLADALGATALDVDVDLDGLPARPRGTVHVEGHDVAGGGLEARRLVLDARTRADGDFAVSLQTWPRRRDGIALEADAVVAVRDAVTVTLGRHRGRARGVTWRGRGGVVALRDDRLTVRGLRAVAAGGRVAIDATYRRTGARADDLTADVTVRQVDLAAVTRLMGRPAGPRGRADVAVHVARRGAAWSGTARGDGRGLILVAAGAPVDVALTADAAPGQLELTATARRDGLGAIDLQLALAAPRDLLAPRAWQRLERTAIRAGRVTLADLDLAGVFALVGRAPEVRGQLAGTLVLTASSTVGQLRGRGLEVSGLPAPLDVDVTLAPAGGDELDARLDLSLRALGAAHAAARVALPARPFDAAGWRGLDAAALREATARVDELVLDAALSRRLGLTTPWQGRVSLDLVAAAGLTDVTLRADARGLRGGPLAAPIDLHLDARVDATGITATGTLDARGGRLLALAGAVDVPSRALRADAVAALRGAPQRGTITVVAVPLRRLLRPLGRDLQVEGRLSASVAIAGTLGAPTATATADLTEVARGTARLRVLHVEARYDAGALHVAARGQQADGGRLQLDADADVAHLDQLHGSVVATGFDLGPLAALGPPRLLGLAGHLDADLTVRGIDPAAGSIAGSLHLRDATVPVGVAVGTLHDADVSVTIAGGNAELTARGRIGEGRVELRGSAALTGLLPHRAELTGELRAVTLPIARRPTIDARVTATIKRDADRWRVSAEVRDATIELSAATGRVLHEVGAPDDLVFVDDAAHAARGAPAARRGLAFGVRPTRPWLVAELELRRTTISSEELRGQIRSSLTVAIGDGAVALDGSVEVLRGDLELFDRRYRVDHARVRFDGNDDPRLDIRLTHAFPAVTLALSIRGRLSKPILELSSSPSSYSQGQLLGLLLGGTPSAEPGSESIDAASAVASSVLSAKLGGYVEEILPIKLDVLRFAAATAGDSASITLGKWLAPRLYVAYRRRLEPGTERNAGEAELEYWLSPRVVIEAIVGDRGHHDLDLTWVRRW